MKFVIVRAQCELSNGTTNLKKTIEAQMGVTVLSITLTYEERDGRK